MRDPLDKKDRDSIGRRITKNQRAYMRKPEWSSTKEYRKVSEEDKKKRKARLKIEEMEQQKKFLSWMDELL